MSGGRRNEDKSLSLTWPEIYYVVPALFASLVTVSRIETGNGGGTIYTNTFF